MKATIVHVTNDVLKYLQYDKFVLPLETTQSLPKSSQWSDGLPVTSEGEVFVDSLHIKRTIFGRNEIKHTEENIRIYFNIIAGG